MSRTVVQIGLFSPSVLLAVAEDLGSLAAAGLEVRTDSVPSSPEQFRRLVSGQYDAVLTSPDNVIAYHYLDQNPLGGRTPLRILTSIDRGLGLSLWARPGLAAPDPARAADGPRLRLGVDVPESGFALAARAMLLQLGYPQESWDTLSLGSTPKRAAAVASGDCDVTILGAGNELRAAAAGCTAWSDIRSLGPYLGTVLATRADRAHDQGLQHLATVLDTVARRILADASLDALLIVTIAQQLGLNDEQAHAHATVLRDQDHGLTAGVIDPAAIETLLQLRAATFPDAQLATVPAGLHDIVLPRRADSGLLT